MNDPGLDNPARPASAQAGVERAGISFLLIVLVWSLLIASLAAWNYHQSYRATLHEVRNTARHSFGKDLAFRKWATRHGGAYVPVSAETPPSRYLSHIPERDITTPSGRALTLINPAYMMRQIHEGGDDLFGTRGHITSLRPRRPENAADAWETVALRNFEDGATEWSSLAEISAVTYLRLMRPLRVEDGCLKCHSVQGYKVGDIIGGISVSIPWAPYRQALLVSLTGIATGYGGIWLLGLLFIEHSRRRLQKHLALRQETEQSLRRSEALYHSFFHDNQAVILLSDPADRRIVDANPAACAYYGYDSETFKDLSRNDVDILPPEAVEPTTPHHFETRHRLAGGEIRDVEVYGGTLEFAGQRLLYSLVHDITERKFAEDALRLRTRELEERTGELERFTYTVSHDLKSPVVTIKSFLGFLEQDLAAQASDKIPIDIDYIRSAAEKMELLLDELLDLSRIGRQVNPPVQIAFQDLIKEVLTLTAGALADRRVEVRVDPVNPILYGDRQRLVEVWQNLVDNAVKFMGDQAAPRLEIGVESAEGSIFFMRDNGMGIEPAYHEKIFGLFERLETGVGGTGLGLALVKRIVELYGGRIWVESSGPGQGACFRFTLPAAVRDRE